LLVRAESAGAPVELAASHEPIRESVIETMAAAEGRRLQGEAPGGASEEPRGAAEGQHPVGEEPRAAGEDAVLRCLDLDEAGRHEELVALAARSVTDVLFPSEGAAVSAALDHAALLSLLMRGRLALGDGAGAAEALAAFHGVGVDPDDPPTSQRLRDIGGRVGRLLLRGAESASDGSDESVRSLEVALSWLEWTQRAAPEDGDASALAAHARQALATARERRIEDLVGRKEFGEALRQLAPALTAGGLGDERRQALGELLWTSLTGETGRLTGQALHGPGGRKALGVMREAERLVRSPVVRKLSRERRQDLDRRIRWAYLTLGISRMEAGDLPGALEPLARAVGMVPPKGAALHGGPPALAAAVETLVAKWSDGILGLARDGDRGAAMSEARGLSRLIDAAFAYGLTGDDLRNATDRRQALMLEIAGDRAP
jgi:hypothetical protein